MSVSIFPSVLDVPREKIQDYIDRVSPFVEGISFDIMDGHFVPPTSFTIEEVASYQVDKLLEVHLMVQHPETMIEGYAAVGADIISIHVESEQPSVEQTLKSIRSYGCRSCLALKPGTAVEDVEDKLWELVDVALIMSVEPGWGGQSFIEGVLDKVRWIRTRFPEMDINIDGGINADTAKQATAAGCSMLVSGSYLYKSEDLQQAVASLRNAT